MNIKKWQIFASIFCLILGTILHFTYEWFNYNVIVGLFSTINESVWEHLKLLFYPMFFISIISSSYLIITISGLNASINPCSFPKEEYGITFNLEIYLLDSSSSV